MPTDERYGNQGTSKLKEHCKANCDFVFIISFKSTSTMLKLIFLKTMFEQKSIYHLQ